ncbi:hypothetical protein [Haliangium sp.]|uniref:hypothetical protein n=1 Tax=Haliangium sp. TaxID=2663208 RepID=UPI003D14230D
MKTVDRPRSRSRARRSRQVHDTERGLEQSLAAAQDGLERFLASIRSSGMAEAAANYRDLQAVLIQQRLWAERHGATRLGPRFRAIAAICKELYEVFATYAGVMQPLKELDKLTAMGEAAGTPRQARAEAAAEAPVGG